MPSTRHRPAPWHQQGAGQMYGGTMDDRKRPLTSMMHNTVLELMNRNQQLQQQRPEQTAFYRTQQGQLADFTRRQAEQDAGTAARRGLAGSEFAIAQGAARQGTQASGERQALAGSEQMLKQEQMQAIMQLLQSMGLYSGHALANRKINADKQAAWIQGISNIVGSIVPTPTP